MRFPLLQFIPARGRKPYKGNISIPCPFDCNLSPRGDGNLHFTSILTRFFPILQFIPARGRKLVCLIQCLPFHIAIYPREGTETLASRRNYRGQPYCNLSPRGDGNAHFGQAWQRNSMDCNLSPRGDGNTGMQTCASLTPLLQFIPARGRKQAAADGDDRPAELQFIPARGRKPNHLRGVIQPIRLQFIPARGRKPIAGNGVRFVRVIAIYPREGTETYPCCRFAASHALQFIPARGRKLLAVQIDHLALIAIYPREGTETCIPCGRRR